MTFTPSSAIEADITAIADTLAETSVGTICTFAAISDAIGRDVGACRYLIPRAIKRVNESSGALFASVRGVGYQRISPDDAHTIGSAARGRVRRTSRRASTTIINAIDRANTLPDDKRRKALGEVATLNMLAHLATERTVRAMPAEGGKVPTIAQSLRGVLDYIGAKPSETA